MGRMYNLGRGISSSVTPYRRNSYEFKGLTLENVVFWKIAFKNNNKTI